MCYKILNSSKLYPQFPHFPSYSHLRNGGKKKTFPRLILCSARHHTSSISIFLQTNAIPNLFPLWHIRKNGCLCYAENELSKLQPQPSIIPEAFSFSKQTIFFINQYHTLIGIIIGRTLWDDNAKETTYRSIFKYKNHKSQIRALRLSLQCNAGIVDITPMTQAKAFLCPTRYRWALKIEQVSWNCAVKFHSSDKKFSTYTGITTHILR